MDGVRRSKRCRALESVARRRVCGERACRRVGWSGRSLCVGMRSLEVTTPVVGEKALMRVSVPAE